MIDVSVIIVTWNCERYIEECLGSVYKNTTGNSFEVIVVDNGSKDKTADIIRNNFPGVVLVQAGRNLGFSPANNYAISLARGRYVFLLNPDTYFNSDVVGELAGFLDSHPDAGCAGPRMTQTNGMVHMFQIRRLPSISNVFFAQFGLRKLFPGSRLFASEILPDFDRNEVREVQFIGGAAMMFPRSVFDDLGLLDEQIPMYFEDLDICARSSAAGRKLYFVHTAEVVHLGAMSSNSSPVKPLLHVMENGQAPWLYFRRYHGRLHTTVFTAVMLASSILRLAAFFVLHKLTPHAKNDLRARFGNQAARSWALTKWSLSRKDRFRDRIADVFQSRADLRPAVVRQIETGTEGTRHPFVGILL